MRVKTSNIYLRVKTSKMVYIIPNFLVLHLGENSIKILTKIAKLPLHENLHKNVNLFDFVWFDSLRPINNLCSRTQRSDASEARTCCLLVSSQALYHWAPHKNVNEKHIFIHIFMQIFMRFYEGQIKQQMLNESMSKFVKFWKK